MSCHYLIESLVRDLRNLRVAKYACSLADMYTPQGRYQLYSALLTFEKLQ